MTETCEANALKETIGPAKYNGAYRTYARYLTTSY
jgi:hypothetical protein